MVIGNLVVIGNLGIEVGHTIFKICRQLDETKIKTCRFSETKLLISKGGYR